MSKQKAEAGEPVKVIPEKQSGYVPALPRGFVGAIADEVAKTVIQRLPNMLYMGRTRKPTKPKPKKYQDGLFLDTSAIIDGRIFEVIRMGLLRDVFVVPSSILAELKHIADSQDMVKRERGRKGLLGLEKLKKIRGVKVIILEGDKNTTDEVDERLIKIAKAHKGKIITCDYNLAKKANIENVTAINVNTLANVLKITAVPGETLHIKVLHVGKDATQGVGYLDDGTMVVVELGGSDVGLMVNVVISRVLQTEVGKILFAKKI